MTTNDQLNEVCDSCGCVAEIGTIIAAGDDRIALEINAANETEANTKFAQYEELAKKITSEVKISSQISNHDNNRVLLKADLQFTCTAEKLIFEMRARYLN